MQKGEEASRKIWEAESAAFGTTCVKRFRVTEEALAQLLQGMKEMQEELKILRKGQKETVSNW